MCSHCGTTHALAARDETPQRVRAVATDDEDDDEERRLARLRAQLPGGIVVPQSLAKIAVTPVYTDEDRATIRRVWEVARDTIVAGKGDDGWELCLYSATWFHFTIEMNADLALRRAHAESALELLKEPRYRHSLRCKLASIAARMNDLDAAERWLGPCDARPDELLADSEHRGARFVIAFRRGRFDELLTIVGHGPGDVPIHRSMVMLTGVMRAHAHEQVGNLDTAVEQMVLLVSQDAATVDALVSGVDLAPLCAKSLPAARARVAAIDASYFNVDYPHLTCDHCGADFEITATTTAVRCTHCGASSAVGLRPLLGAAEAFQGPFPGALDLPSNLRERLLSQRATVIIPADLAPLFHEGRLAPGRVADAEEQWRKEVRLVAEGSKERSSRLMLLTSAIWSAEAAPGAPGRRHGRAMLETALRVIRDPTYLLRLRCTVATSAAQAGDFEAAAAWLARCDPRTEDLAAYSAMVLTRARIANLRGDFAETVRLLGPAEGDAPVSLQTRVVVALIRAAALERLGREGDAVESLMPILRWAADARSALVAFVADFDKDGEPSPTRSMAVALADFGRQRAIFRSTLLAVLVVLAVAAYHAFAAR